MPNIQTSLGIPDLKATGNLTAAQPLINTPVAGATVVLVLTGGQSAFKMQLAGAFSAGSTVVFDTSMDGGTTWWPSGGHQSGGTSGALVTSIVGGAPAKLTGSCAGETQVRARCTAFQGGDNIAVTLHVGAGVADVSLLAALPPGANTIGGITLPPNASQETGGNLAAILTQLMATLGVQLNDMALALRLMYEQMVNPMSQDPLTGRTRVSVDNSPNIGTVTTVSGVSTVALVQKMGISAGAGLPTDNLPPDIGTVAWATAYRPRIV